MDVDFRKLVDHPVYTVIVDGVAIIAHPGVFAPDPRYSNSTALIVAHLPELAGKDVLDLGCGTGVFAVIAAKRGAARVLATDLDPAALRNTEENVRRHQLEGVVRVAKSDLFSDITGSFDVILANLPIWDELWNVKTTTTDLNQAFLLNVKNYLKPGGVALLAWFSASPVEPVRAALHAAGFTVEEFTEENIGYTWYLFVLRNPVPAIS